MVSPEISDQKPGVLTTFRVLLTFLFVGIVVALVLYMIRGTNTYDSGRSAKRSENLQKLNALNAKRTNEYLVLDAAKGTYQLPIKESMSLTVRDLSTAAPSSANPIATPAPAAPAAVPPATTVPATGGAPTPASTESSPAAVPTPSVVSPVPDSSVPTVPGSAAIPPASDSSPAPLPTPETPSTSSSASPTPAVPVTAVPATESIPSVQP